MTPTYKAVIIDDEPHAVEVLAMLLQKNCPNVDVVATTSESTAAAELILKHHPDVVFLDIEMPRLNGFSLLESLPSLHFHLIFTTAYDQYAVKAFRYSALDYLLKPVLAKDLREAISKLPEKKSPEREQLKLTEENLRLIKLNTVPDKIILPHAKGYTFQKLDEIIYCEAMSAYCKFHFEGKQPLVIAKGLGDIEELLKDAGFFRAHRQYLVNVKKIQELLREDSGTLLMTDGTKIPVARNRKDDFFALMR